MIALFPAPLPGTFRTPAGGTRHVWVLGVSDYVTTDDPAVLAFLVVPQSGGTPWWDTGIRIDRLVHYPSVARGQKERLEVVRRLAAFDND